MSCNTPQTAVPLSPTPTLLPAAILPDQSPIADPQPPIPDSQPPISDPQSLLPTPIPPASAPLHPNQAQQNFVRDAGPSNTTEWRPPPMDVPLSLHPDDHYWLIRPIPSGKRNYDLEWYPFGNDVLIAEIGPYRVHHGMDFPNDQGTQILAAGSGTVIHAGSLPSPRNGVNYYGNTVIIHHDWQWQGQDVYTLYAHTLELFVKAGDYVEAGQLIAGVGSSGEVSGSHLHLEVRVGANTYASAQNPALWLAPYEGWGTLAGQLLDSRGRMIPNALITVEATNGSGLIRRQRTYYPSIRSDQVWQENFVFGDLPNGRYRMTMDVGSTILERFVTVQPGQTSFEIAATNFVYVPPTPTPLPLPTGVITTTAVITP